LGVDIVDIQYGNVASCAVLSDKVLSMPSSINKIDFSTLLGERSH
jgi:hypothetical protein